MIPEEVKQRNAKKKLAEQAEAAVPDIEEIDRRIFFLTIRRFVSVLVRQAVTVSMYFLLLFLILYGAFHAQHWQYKFNKCYETKMSVKECF